MSPSVQKLLLPITLVAQLYMVTGRARPGAGRYVVESVAYYRGGVHLYDSDQLGILSEQPEGEGSSEASIMARRARIKLD